MFARCMNCAEGQQSGELDVVDAVLDNFVDEINSSIAKGDDSNPGENDAPVDHRLVTL